MNKIKLIESVVKKLMLERVYRSVRHGTTLSAAKTIKDHGFKLPPRGALFFDRRKTGELAHIYGADTILTADIFSKNEIDMADVRKKIIPYMKQSGISVSEVSVHNELRRRDYDLIVNGNELIVLDPNIIKNISVDG